MKNIFVTITGQNHYLGMKPYKVGRIVKLAKDVDNEHDENAIAVILPFIDVIGYVANSTNTVFQGTYSAGRLYDKIGDSVFAEVMIITHSSVIARVLTEDEESEFKKANGIGNNKDDTVSDEEEKNPKSLSKIGF